MGDIHIVNGVLQKTNRAVCKESATTLFSILIDFYSSALYTAL
jgi:hypothetical protein